MNKPAKIATATPPAYDKDVYGWALAQAELIRSGRLGEIDIENVAEEIESVGKSEYRALESALRIVLLHRLKWQFQPTHRSRSWQNSIRSHLIDFEELLADNPSLKSRLDEIRKRSYRSATVEAAVETGLAIEGFPAEPPSWDEIRADVVD